MKIKLADGTTINFYTLDKKPKTIDDKTQVLMLTCATQIKLPDIVIWHEHVLPYSVYLASESTEVKGQYMWVESSAEYRKRFIELIKRMAQRGKQHEDEWLWALVSESKTHPVSEAREVIDLTKFKEMK